MNVGDDSEEARRHGGVTRAHWPGEGQALCGKACVVVVPRGTLAPMRLRGLLILILIGLTSSVRAEEADILARIHVEAIGGTFRLGLLNSLQTTGYVYIDERRLEFTLLAQRPNRILMETRWGDNYSVQGTDGVAPPWQINPKANPPTPSSITDRAEREFSADAEFDDPLVNPAARGYELDYAGEVEWAGRKSFRILVTRRHVDSYHLIVDAETYFITGKESVRTTEFGREVPLRTLYEDFRPVAGVIMPHRILVTADGKQLHKTILLKVEPNAPVPPGSFERPATPAQRPPTR